jgi:hypothetical protein
MFTLHDAAKVLRPKDAGDGLPYPVDLFLDEVRQGDVQRFVANDLKFPAGG